MGLPRSMLPLYLTLHYSTMSLLQSSWLCCLPPWLYFTVHDSTILYHGSASLYLTLHYSTMAPLHPSWIYIIVSWLNFTLLDLYITLPWLYLTLLDSPAFYHKSTLCLALLLFTIALLHCTWLYTTLPWFSFTLYFTLPWLYFTLCDSTLGLVHSTWL